MAQTVPLTDVTGQRIAAALESIASAQSAPAPDQWLPVFTDGMWLRHPLNEEVPDDSVPSNPLFDPWTASHSTNGSVQVIQRPTGQRAARVALNEAYSADGSTDYEQGLFLNDHNQWSWFGRFAFETIRVRFKALYEAKFNFVSDPVHYFQSGFEIKTFDTKRTAVQTNLELAPNEVDLIHWGVCGDVDLHPVNPAPIVFGVPLSYEYVIALDTDPTKGYLKFTYTPPTGAPSTFQGYGRTLSLGGKVATNNAGGGFIIHTNGVHGFVGVEYSDIIIEVLQK